MGTVRYHDDMAHAMLDALATRANAASPCKFKYYSGTMPATPTTAITSQVLLATLPCSATIETGPASSRTLTFDAITTDSAGDADGVTSFVGLVDDDDVVLFYTDAGNLASSAGVKMTNTTIASGAPVAATSFTISVPVTITF